jgi:hypothetical protein
MRAEVEGKIDFICECVDDSCFAAVPLTLSEYRDARAAEPLVVPGHKPG